MASALAALSVLSLACASSAEFVVSRHVSNVARTVVEPADIPPAQFVMPITQTTPRRASKRANLAALRAYLCGDKDTAVLSGSDLDQEYLTDVTVGGQTFPLIVDTGSSDTWVIQSGFQCYNLTTDAKLPEPDCDFGPKSFDTSASKTFKSFPKVSFNISYGDGEFLSGPVGFDTVTAGGLTVKSQEIGVPNLAAWEGDSVNSGLIGLAFPELTSVFNTTDPTKASSANHIPYNPFFFTAVQQGAVSNPYFSVALNRGNSTKATDPNLGFVAFGGIAPVELDKTAVTLAIEGYSTKTFAPIAKGGQMWYYTVPVDGYVFTGSSKLKTASNNTILDTGTTLNYVPSPVAKAYNDLFVPKATFDEGSGLYFVDCHPTTVPEFNVMLRGKHFPIDARDQVLNGGTDENCNLNKVCISGTQDGGKATVDNFFILGDVFLHNVVR